MYSPTGVLATVVLLYRSITVQAIDNVYGREDAMCMADVFSPSTTGYLAFPFEKHAPKLSLLPTGVLLCFGATPFLTSGSPHGCKREEEGSASQIRTFLSTVI